MSSSIKPWLEPLLHNALLNYLNGDRQRSPRVQYLPDNSNLRIQLPDLGARDLIITELLRPSGFFRGIIIDGCFSLPFLCPDERLREILPSKAKPDPAAIAYCTTVSSIELRISNCFTPPKIEAYIEDFSTPKPLNAAHMFKPGSNLPLSAAPSIIELLEQHSTLHGSSQRQVEMAASSPLSFKSQAAPSHSCVYPELEEMDSSPISQVRLITQQPLPQVLPEARVPMKELESNRFSLNKRRRVQNSLGANNDKASLENLLNGDAKRQLRRDSNSNEQIDALRRREVQFLGSLIKTSNTKADVVSPRGSVEIAPQKSPSSVHAVTEVTRPNANAGSNPTTLKAKNEIAKDRDKDRQSPEPSSKTKRPQHDVAEKGDLQMRFKRCKTEVAGTCHIPRRMCKIPQSQLSILESDQRWQPPLPGQPFRPATVPIDLLNELTVRADEVARSLTTFPQPESPQSHTPTTSRVFQDQLSDPAINKLQNLASSQELPESEWSPSPERRRSPDALPPDSSPVSPPQLVEQHEDVTLVGLVDDPEVEESDDEVNGEQPKENSVKLDQSIPHESAQSRSEKPTQESSLAAGVESTPEPEIPSATAQRGPRTVQVIDTPFPGRIKSAPPTDDVRTGAVPSTYVPCTYTEALPSDDKFGATAPQSQVVLTTDARDNSWSNHGQKRKLFNNEGATSPKRAKGSNDPDYAAVMEKKRQYRRQVLQDIAKVVVPKSEEQVLTKTATSSIHSHGSGPAMNSRRQSNSNDCERVSTPATAPTSCDSSSRKVEVHSFDGRKSEATINTVLTAFDQYKTAYQDYEGGKENFDSTLQRLKKLRTSSRAPHPSLFDDFIFHRFHSYRPYLILFAEAGEDPVPYEVYFNENIEGPNHRKRVITQSVLDGLSTSKSSDISQTMSTSVTPVHLSSRSETTTESITIESAVFKTHPPVLHNHDPKPSHESIVSSEPKEAGDSSQRTSVESWLEKTARAGSPELGTPDVDRSENPSRVTLMPPPTRRAVTLGAVSLSKPSASQPKGSQARKVKRHSASPFARSLQPVSTPGRLESKLTPFQLYAKQIMNLPEEQSASRQREAPPRMVDIFSWR